MRETNSPASQRDTEIQAVLEIDDNTMRLVPTSDLGYQSIDPKQAAFRLEKLVFAMRGTIETPDQFPADLLEGEARARKANRQLYTSSETINKVPHQYRIIRIGNTVGVIGLRSNQYFTGDFYHDGEYRGGNHDLSLHEVYQILTRLNSERDLT